MGRGGETEDGRTESEPLICANLSEVGGREGLCVRRLIGAARGLEGNE